MADFVRVPKADWQNILDAVRGKTGGTEKMLSGVVASEIAGLQSGGDAGSASGIYMAKVTPASDVSEIEVTHNLGTTDILLACCWAETLGDVVPTFNGSVGSFWFKNDIPNPRTDSTLTLFASYSATNTKVLSAGMPNSPAYWCNVVDENTFEFKRASSATAKFFAGVTYTVVIMAASSFSVTEV
jgi:hypothetical protein